MMTCLLTDEQFEQAEEHTGLTDQEEEEANEEEKDEDRKIKHYGVDYILHLDETSICLRGAFPLALKPV